MTPTTPPSPSASSTRRPPPVMMPPSDNPSMIDLKAARTAFLANDYNSSMRLSYELFRSHASPYWVRAQAALMIAAGDVNPGANNRTHAAAVQLVESLRGVRQENIEPGYWSLLQKVVEPPKTSESSGDETRRLRTVQSLTKGDLTSIGFSEEVEREIERAIKIVDQDNGNDDDALLRTLNIARTLSKTSSGSHAGIGSSDNDAGAGALDNTEIPADSGDNAAVGNSPHLADVSEDKGKGVELLDDNPNGAGGDIDATAVAAIEAAANYSQDKDEGAAGTLSTPLVTGDGSGDTADKDQEGATKLDTSSRPLALTGTDADSGLDIADPTRAIATRNVETRASGTGKDDAIVTTTAAVEGSEDKGDEEQENKKDDERPDDDQANPETRPKKLKKEKAKKVARECSNCNIC
ncbi:hypothetical protein ACLMJK_006623 [Lecanora helva]